MKCNYNQSHNEQYPLSKCILTRVIKPQRVIGTILSQWTNAVEKPKIKKKIMNKCRVNILSTEGESRRNVVFHQKLLVARPPTPRPK